MKQKEYDQWNDPQKFYSEDYSLPKKGVATPREYLVECYLNMVSVTSVSRYITSSYHPRYQSDLRCSSVVGFHGLSRNWPSQFQLCKYYLLTKLKSRLIGVGIPMRYVCATCELVVKTGPPLTFF